MADATLIESEAIKSLDAIGDRDESDRFFEVVDGERQEIEPMGAFEQSVASVLEILLGIYALQNRTGLPVTEVLFTLRESPRLQRRPDVAFVTYDRWPDQPHARGEAWDTVPDLVIEIISPTNLATDVDRKIGDYFEAGVRQVWVLYPETRRLYAFTSPKETIGYDAGDVVPGGEVLPGFELRIDDIFAPLTKPDQAGE